MNTIRVTFNCDVPVDALPSEVEEWLKYELNQTGGINMKNKMVDYEIEANNVTVDYID